MDVNATNEVKGFGLPVSSVAERNDGAKPLVAPVAKGGDSSKTALDKRNLKEREAQEQKALSAEEAAEAVREMQARLDSIGNTRLNFSLHKEPDAVVVQITDRNSGELLRQFPAEETLQLRKKLNELVGLLFDEKA